MNAVSLTNAIINLKVVTSKKQSIIAFIQSLNLTVKYVKKIVVNPEEQYFIISHSDREQLALTLKDELEKNIKCKKVFVSDVYSGCGTNIGPGMIGVYFLGNPVSEDSAYEKEVLTKIIAENE